MKKYKTYEDLIVVLASTVLDKKDIVSCHDIHEQLRFIDKILGVNETNYDKAYKRLLIKYKI